MIIFIIWSVIGLIFVGLGIKALLSSKPLNFWANVDMKEVKDVKGYNRATGKLFIGYGLILILLGIPLGLGFVAGLLVTILGTVFLSIIVMAIYSVHITSKFIDKK